MNPAKEPDRVRARPRPTTDQNLLLHPDYRAVMDYVHYLEINIALLERDLKGCSSCFEAIANEFVAAHYHLGRDWTKRFIVFGYRHRLPESLMGYLRDKFQKAGLL